MEIHTGKRRTGANFVCFTKNWVKIGTFPHATPYEQKLKKKIVSGLERSKTA